MKIVNKIEKVGNDIFPFLEGIFYSNLKPSSSWETMDLCYVENNTISVKYKGDFSYGKDLNGSFIWQPTNGQNLYCIDERFTNLLLMEGEIYFSTIALSARLNNNLIFGKRDQEKEKYFIFRKNRTINEVKRIYFTETNKYWISPQFESSPIGIYDKNETLLYQIDINEHIPPFGIVKKKDSLVILASENLILIPIENGQLYALNIEDGSLKWATKFEGVLGGDYELYEDKIYRNTGDFLMEIDIHSGNLLRTIEYKKFSELKDMFGITGNFRIYDDYIILKDQIRGYVIMLDRKTLELAEFVDVGCRLPSGMGGIHWCNKQLYVVDYRNHILNIYQK